MERAKPYHPNKLEIMRHFLPRLFLGSITAIGSTPSESLAKFDQPPSVEQLADRISNFEALAGLRILTREEESEHIRNSIALTVGSLAPHFPVQRYIDRIYVYRGPDQFLQDYPLYYMTDDRARALLNMQDLNYAGSNNTSYGNVIYMTNINNVGPYSHMFLFQGEFGRDLKCLPYAPAPFIRSTASHETIHDLIFQEEHQEVDESTFEAVLSYFEWEWGESLRDEKYDISIKMNGFVVNLQVSWEDGEGNLKNISREYKRFAEVLTDYIKDKNFAEVNLPYGSSYVNPLDTYNLTKVLEKADINYRELFEIAGNNDYYNFFLRLGLAAEGEFESLQDRINRMYGLLVGGDRNLDWGSIKYHFPEVVQDRIIVRVNGNTCEIVG